MISEDFLKVLKEYTGFELNTEEPLMSGMGSPYKAFLYKHGIPKNEHYYLTIHLPKCIVNLQSLPWTQFVNYPRNPQSNEYPTEEGEYITMLDDYQVLVNRFRDGAFSFYHRTHIKWWIKL